MLGKWGRCDEEERSEDYKDDVRYCAGLRNPLDSHSSDYHCDPRYDR